MEYFPISPTRCRALHCGFYFQQRYLVERQIEELEGVTLSLNLLRGSLMHKVLELYNTGLLDPKKKLMTEAELFEECFVEAWESQDAIPEPLYEDIRTRMLSFVENNPINTDILWSAEKKIALGWDLNEVDWESPTVFIRGILDRIDVDPTTLTATITDYKHFLPAENKLRHGYQTKIYPFLLAQLNPYLTGFEIVYHSIQNNRKVKFYCSRGEAVDYESQLRSLSKRVAKKVANPEYVWKPFPGENCPYCPFECPLINAGVEIIRSQADAVKHASQLYAYEREVSRLKTALGSYLGQTGEAADVDIGAGVYIVNESSFYKGLQASNWLKICEEKGLDIDKMLKVNSDSLKKIEDEELKKELTEGGKPTTVKRLTFQKKNVETVDDEE